MAHENKKLVQLIPADGWMAIYRHEQTQREYKEMLACWGLRQDGEVTGLCSTGIIDGLGCETAGNFLRYDHASEC